ncbi:MAG: sialate O-acetylesterase [Mangrovibacterium sp.]
MKRILLLLIAAMVCAYAEAQIKLPELISDGMVLQQNVPLKIWGWASPNEHVTMIFQGKSYTATTSEEGKWLINLPPQTAGGAFQMNFKGKNEISVKDILIGEVWLCSGQSNMELPIRRVLDLYAAEIAQVDNSQIREFRVPKTYDFKTQKENTQGAKWYHASLEHIMEFSAVGYFFAEEIQAKYHIPVGLINSALGGSPVESWMNEEYLKPYEEAYRELQKVKDDAFVQSVKDAEAKTSYDWHVDMNNSDEGLNKWSAKKIKEKDWKEIALPRKWYGTELEQVNGAVWMRKTVKIPPSMIGKEGMIELGCIVDADSVFINGEFVGWTSYQYPPRKYQIPAHLLVKGENTIAIKILSQRGVGSVVPEKNYWIAVGDEKVSLEGTWKYKVGSKMAALPGDTFFQWKPAGLHNAMISPLTNYAIKGALWYQGESNVGTKDYANRLSDMVANWRAEWGQGDFPFVIIQVANFQKAFEHPTESGWAELRQAQYDAYKRNRNMGLSVLTDIGEWNDIHPLNKKTVGERTALAAEHLAYGATDEYSGPELSQVEIAGEQVVLSFSHVGAGLEFKGESLQGFAIAGADKQFKWAEARVEGNLVILSSKEVKNPLFVRYAWADNPDKANLYNKNGLPAIPFRTDK